MARLLLTVLPLAVGVVVLLGAAHAAEPRRGGDARREARRLVERGMKRFGGGRYLEAARLFEAAYGLLPRPEVRYNAARAWELGEHLSYALEAYGVVAMAREAAPTLRERAAERAREVRRQLAARRGRR